MKADVGIREGQAGVVLRETKLFKLFKLCHFVENPERILVFQVVWIYFSCNCWSPEIYPWKRKRELLESVSICFCSIRARLFLNSLTWNFFFFG